MRILVISIWLAVLSLPSLTDSITNQNLDQYVNSAWAGDAEAQSAIAVHLYMKERYDQSFRWFSVAAESKDANALYYLGQHYYWGHAVDLDVEQAFEYTRAAAQLNHVQAQFLLATMYTTGYASSIGVAENHSKALTWYRAAARNNHKRAVEVLLEFERDPKWGKSKPPAILRYTRQLAELGDVEALRKLAQYYVDGYGTAQNMNLAIASYEKLFDAGQIDAAYKLARIYELRLTGTIANQNKAEEWLLKGAEAGHVQSQLHLAERYHYGSNNPEEQQRAVHWYMQAAAQDNIAAMFALGTLHYHGTFVPFRNFAEAARLFEKAAEANHGPAKFYLGQLYLEGQGAVQDIKKAFSLFVESADLGVEQAIAKVRGMCKQRLDILLSTSFFETCSKYEPKVVVVPEVNTDLQEPAPDQSGAPPEQEYVKPLIEVNWPVPERVPQLKIPKKTQGGG